ncbi:hypothetical protein V1505DRAFT_379848 [Lipomyces doorenjongii]
MGSGTLHRRLELTTDQRTAVHDLIDRVALLKSRSDITGSDLNSSTLARVARLSMTVLLQEFDVVNRVLRSGESGVSQYLVRRAINLLSLRPNGSFLNYMQITHITAAIRYALRSTMLYRVTKAEDVSVADENHIDDECARFLVPQRSTSFHTVYRCTLLAINLARNISHLQLLGLLTTFRHFGYQVGRS